MCQLGGMSYVRVIFVCFDNCVMIKGYFDFITFSDYLFIIVRFISFLIKNSNWSKSTLIKIDKKN